jgi:hypothetical protein
MTAYINDLFEWKFPRTDFQGTGDFSMIIPGLPNARKKDKCVAAGPYPHAKPMTFAHDPNP